MGRPRPALPDLSAVRSRIDQQGMLNVRVTANAASDEVRLDEDGSNTIAVRTTATPEHGKANDAVLRLLAKALDVPASSLELVRGATSRNKVVRVTSIA